MKYLVVGLGNVGAEYENTRHNIGFDVVDKLATEFEVSFEVDRLGAIGKFRHKGRTFFLLKPTTYMNLSGKAVKYWMNKENVQFSNVLIVVDDLNLSLGKMKLKGKGSDGGHNGLKDITEKLGQNTYSRLRIGIGDDFSKGRQVDFVLGKWTAEEQPEVDKMMDKAAEAVKSFGTIGLQHTMNEFNG